MGIRLGADAAEPARLVRAGQRPGRRDGRPGGIAGPAAVYLGWPLFAVLLDNAEMSLAKTNRRIAERYLRLGGRPDLTAAVLAEYDRPGAWCSR